MNCFIMWQNHQLITGKSNIDFPSKLVGYLWSKYDFYKVISIDETPHCPFVFVLSKTNTVELYMDQGGNFNFAFTKLLSLLNFFEIWYTSSRHTY